MSVMNQSGEEQVECPLCMEPLEVDDLNFFPCTCGYQICRFCWHRIRTDENGLCPACRKGYPENPADFKPLSQEEVAKLKAEKRHKDQQRKQKITENRKHLANVRVVQRNLVFVVGLPMRLADSEVLKKHEYFGKFGKIHKVVINQCTSYAGTQGPSASAYVTYQRADDALRAIQAVNNISVDGRSIKSSLGTTKYCSHFMKNQACPKPDCMYLHDQGDSEASFTKEDMQQGKHQEYERKLHEALIAATARERKPTPSPPATGVAVGAAAKEKEKDGKEAWPSLQPGLPGAVNGNATTTNGKENGRSKNGSKNPTVAKKRHSSGDDDRGKLGEKHPAYCPDPPSPVPAAAIDDSSSSASSSSEESEEAPGDSVPAAPTSAVGCKPTQHMLAAARLLDQDNNSFFSSNSFAKVNSDDTTNTGVEWSSTPSSMPDAALPPVHHPAEDWEAAFGFTARSAHAAHQPGDNPRRAFTQLHSQLQPHDANRLGFPGSTHRLTNGTSKFFSAYHNGTDHQADTVSAHRHAPGSYLDLVDHRPFRTPFCADDHTVDHLQHSAYLEAPALHRYRPEVASQYGLEAAPTLADEYRHRNGEDSYAAAHHEDASESVNDDWGFDLFHETQKALAELMEKEAPPPPPTAAHGRTSLHQPPPSQPQQGYHYTHSQTHRGLSDSSSSAVPSSCSRLLEGLGLGGSQQQQQSPAAVRSRLPPPGFTAPNHMNAFGLGIPRPAHTASKILPFLSRNNNNSSSSSTGGTGSNGSLSPQPGAYRSTVNGSAGGHTHFNHKEWFAEHAPLTQTSVNSAAKGWTGPCTDWTQLDPAIVSTSRHLHNSAPPPQSAAVTAPSWNAYFGGAGGAQDWSAPPPGFGSRQAAAGHSSAADLAKLENENTFLCF